MEQTQIRKPFLDASSLPWTRLFVDGFDEIHEEVTKISRLMTPVYREYTESLSPMGAQAPSWFTSTLLFFTIQNPAIIPQMPATWRLLQEVPGLVTAMLLRMEGGTHLKAHCGYSPDTLRCHLGVVVPEPDDVVLRVDNEHRTWAPRHWLVFDDYLEHEVWHRGKLSRTVLLVDIVRPGVEATAKKVARDFFEGAPGTRFDEELAKVAPAAKWLQWVDAGKFG